VEAPVTLEPVKATLAEAEFKPLMQGLGRLAVVPPPLPAL